MSTRIVVCIDLDTDQLDEAYRQVSNTMGRTGLDWESSDEWFYDDGSMIPEFVVSAARMKVFGEKKEPTRRPIDYVCEECKGGEVSFAGLVEFCPVSQDFIVQDTCDKGHYCPNCESECHIQEIEYFDTLLPAIAGDYAAPRGS